MLPVRNSWLPVSHDHLVEVTKITFWIFLLWSWSLEKMRIALIATCWPSNVPCHTSPKDPPKRGWSLVVFNDDEMESDLGRRPEDLQMDLSARSHRSRNLPPSDVPSFIPKSIGSEVISSRRSINDVAEAPERSLSACRMSGERLASAKSVLRWHVIW